MDYTEYVAPGSGRTTRMLQQIEEYAKDSPGALIAVAGHTHRSEKMLIAKLIQRGVPKENLIAASDPCRTPTRIYYDTPQ